MIPVGLPDMRVGMSYAGLNGTPAARHAARGYDPDGSERGGDDDMNDACEVPAAIDAELMGWDTYDDGYAGS